ncbi:MAG: DNA recombination protein RmuC [Gemmatimonadota bacterium]|nr:MAG: DNA recombination protein RmuC [Gemmatimonadota bacterium]
MGTFTIVLLLIVIFLSVVLLGLQLRGGGKRDLALLQQQLIELRTRLDTVAMAQHEVPRALAEGSAEQARSLTEVQQQLVRLAEATTRLENTGKAVTEVQELLRVPRLRGTLGEVWLEELLRQVFPSALYDLQHGFRSGDRVDAVVKVGDKLVPIDSKFPLEACQRMLSAAASDEARERKAFNRSLRERVDQIAAKYIRPDEGTYNFALMYIPAENVYYEAVIASRGDAGEPGLSSYALERKVIPVSPNTLYAYLVAILHGLRGLEVEERAREILDSLAGLQQQLSQFERAYELVGRHLSNAVKQYDETERQLGLIQRRFDSVGSLRAASSGEPLTERAPGHVPDAG